MHDAKLRNHAAEAGGVLNSIPPPATRSKLRNHAAEAGGVLNSIPPPATRSKLRNHAAEAGGVHLISTPRVQVKAKEPRG
jgi:hypothetical protein